MRRPANLAETPKYFTNTGAIDRKNQKLSGWDIRSPSDANFTRNPGNSGNSENLDSPRAVLGMFRISRDRRPAIQIWRILHRWSGYTLSVHTTRVGLGGLRRSIRLAETTKYFTNTGMRKWGNRVLPNEDYTGAIGCEFYEKFGNSGNSENLAIRRCVWRLSEFPEFPGFLVKLAPGGLRIFFLGEILVFSVTDSRICEIFRCFCQIGSLAQSS